MKPVRPAPEKKHELHQELPLDFPDPFFRTLHYIIRFAIRVLALGATYWLLRQGQEHEKWDD